MDNRAVPATSPGCTLPEAERFGAVFLRHWSGEPSLAPLPAPGSGAQLVRLLQALARAKPEPRRFSTLCRRLARSWRERGVAASHFDAGGAVLLRSLSQCLSEEFEEQEEGWAKLYGEAAESVLAALGNGQEPWQSEWQSRTGEVRIGLDWPDAKGAL